MTKPTKIHTRGSIVGLTTMIAPNYPVTSRTANPTVSEDDSLIYALGGVIIVATEIVLQ